MYGKVFESMYDKTSHKPMCVGCGYPVKANHRYCNQCRHFGNIAVRIEFHLRVGFISEVVV